MLEVTEGVRVNLESPLLKGPWSEAPSEVSHSERWLQQRCDVCGRRGGEEMSHVTFRPHGGGLCRP